MPIFYVGLVIQRQFPMLATKQSCPLSHILSQHMFLLKSYLHDMILEELMYQKINLIIIILEGNNTKQSFSF